MKKLIILLIAVLTVFMLVSCGECENHTDIDGNGQCDTCGLAVEVPCTNHTDTDLNGKCDACGVDYRNPCTEHTDTDLNGKCDACGVDYRNPCTEHTDTDLNGKCDTCGIDFRNPCAEHTDSEHNGKCDICGEDYTQHKDVNRDGRCDICDASAIVEIDGESGLALMNALIAQLEKAKSFNAEYSLNMKLNEYYWEIDDKTDLPVLNEKDGMAFEGIANFVLTVSETENGINASIIADVKSTNLENGRMETDVNGGVVYLIDGILYTYNKETDGYLYEPFSSTNTKELEALLIKLTEKYGADEEELNQILGEIGKNVLITLDVMNNKGSALWDFVPVYDDFVEYVNSLKIGDTLGDILNNILALIDEELTCEVLLERIEDYYSLTLNEYLDLLDEKLVAKYDMDLQELFEDAVNDGEISQLIIDYAISQGLSEEEAEAFLEKLKETKIRDEIPKELFDTQLYDIFIMYFSYDSNGEYVDFETFISVIENSLETTVGETILDYGFPMSDILEFIKYVELRECYSKLDVNFKDLFNIQDLEWHSVLDMSCLMPSLEVDGEKDELVLKIETVCKVYNISESPVEIQCPPENKPHYINIFDKVFIDENGNYLVADIVNMGTVEVVIYCDDIEISIKDDIFLIKKNVVELNIRNAKITKQNGGFVSFEHRRENIVITFDLENGTFNVTMPPFYTPPSVVITIYFDAGEYGDDSQIEIQKSSNISSAPLLSDQEQNYIFEGWYLDEEYTEKLTKSHTFYEDTILYAKWIPSCRLGGEHLFNNAVKISDATCQEGAVYEGVCRICWGKFQYSGGAIGHDFGLPQSYKAATCTEPGINIKYCNLCSYSETVKGDPARGHHWTDWTDGHLMMYRTCLYWDCDYVDKITFENITQDCLENGNISVFGEFFGSNVETIVNGDWNDGAIAPKANQEFSIEITMDVATDIDRVYIKGHGTGTTVYVCVMYEGEDEYSLVGTVVLSAEGEYEEDEKASPYVIIADGEKITGVMVKILPLSQPTEHIDEIALTTAYQSSDNQ